MSALDIVDHDRRWDAARTAAARRWGGRPSWPDERAVRWAVGAEADDEGALPRLRIAVRGDEVVGQLGLRPLRVAAGDRVIEILAVRVSGSDDDEIERTLLADALDRGGTLVAIAGRQASAASREASGFRRTAGPTVMGLDLRHPRDSSILPRSLASVVARMAGPLRGPAWSRRPELAAGLTGPAAVCRWPDVDDAVAARDAALRDGHVVHDTPFLAWRCGGLDGVVREVDAVRTPEASFALLERADGALHVLDWHAVSPDECAAVVARTAFTAAAYGSEEVRFLAPSAAEQAALQAVGCSERPPIEVWAAGPETATLAEVAWRAYDLSPW